MRCRKEKKNQDPNPDPKVSFFLQYYDKICILRILVAEDAFVRMSGKKTTRLSYLVKILPTKYMNTISTRSRYRLTSSDVDHGEP